MDDILTVTPQPSRFFEEELDNFAAPSPFLPSPFLILNPNPNPSLLHSSLLVVSMSSPSLALLHRIPSRSLIGTLILPEILLSENPLNPSPRDRSCRIYAAGESVVLVAVKLPVSANRSRLVTKCLMGKTRPERLLVLDSVRGQNDRGRLSADEALAFKLKMSEERRGGDPVVRGVEYLPLVVCEKHLLIETRTKALTVTPPFIPRVNEETGIRMRFSSTRGTSNCFWHS